MVTHVPPRIDADPVGVVTVLLDLKHPVVASATIATRARARFMF
jgi:ABC-type Fe2+-enterobactin transport system substrate-binding protein